MGENVLTLTQWFLKFNRLFKLQAFSKPLTSNHFNNLGVGSAGIKSMTSHMLGKLSIIDIHPNTNFNKFYFPTEKFNLVTFICEF